MRGSASVSVVDGCPFSVPETAGCVPPASGYWPSSNICWRSRSACSALRYNSAPICASRLLPAMTSSCFSARSYAPAKQSSSKRKVRRRTSVGSPRRSAASASIASSTFPASNSNRAFNATAPAASRGHLLHVPAPDHGLRVLGTRHRLRVVRDRDLAEGDAQRLRRPVVAAGAARPLHRFDEAVLELVRQIRHRIAARLVQRELHLGEVLALRAELEQHRARLVRRLHAIEARQGRAPAARALGARADRRRVRDAPAEAVDLDLLLEALAGRLALDILPHVQKCVERHCAPSRLGLIGSSPKNRRFGPIPSRARPARRTRSPLRPGRAAGGADCGTASPLTPPVQAGPPPAASTRSARRAGSAAAGTPRRGTRPACPGSPSRQCAR